MDYNLHIQKLLIQVDAEKSPQNKVSLIKQAISLADLHNDIEWSFDLRIILFEEFKMPKLEDMMPAFVWLLDAFDNNPELFDEEELLWIYDWIIYVSSKDYNISLEQLNAMLDDYKNRLLRCGYSVRTYYKSKIALGFVIEDFDMIHENLTLRNQSVNDDMSSNEFDDLSDDISYYLQTGNIDKAIELFPEIKKLNTDTIHISSSYAEEITRCKRFDIIDQFITEAINDLSSTSKDDNLMVSTSAIAFALV